MQKGRINQRSAVLGFCWVFIHYCQGSTIAADEKSHWIEFPQSLQVMLQVLGTTYRFAKPASIWHLYFETLFICSLYGSRDLRSRVARGWNAFTENKTDVKETPILIQKWEKCWHSSFTHTKPSKINCSTLTIFRKIRRWKGNCLKSFLIQFEGNVFVCYLQVAVDGPFITIVERTMTSPNVKFDSWMNNTTLQRWRIIH